MCAGSVDKILWLCNKYNCSNIFFLCWGKNSGLWACLVLSYQNISLAFQNLGVCVHACRCVEIKGNQHAISQKATTLFLDSGSHWPGNSSSSLDWLASESPEFPLFYLLSAGSVRGHHHIQPLPRSFLINSGLPTCKSTLYRFQPPAPVF